MDEFEEGDSLSDSVPFRELVGGLMWLACQTRADIAHSVRDVGLHPRIAVACVYHRRPSAVEAAMTAFTHAHPFPHGPHPPLVLLVCDTLELSSLIPSTLTPVWKQLGLLWDMQRRDD